MEAQDWARARALFEELADAEPDSWDAALDARGIVDAALRAEVLGLLQADRAALLQTDLAAQAPQMLAELADAGNDDAPAALAGRSVGPFRLLREIGRGGMGTVWLAERVDGQFEQQVAIKLIRSGWDASEVVARFRAERQILANLTHPNIARLIDGGMSGDGRPWLALEHVDGVDLRQYCDRNQLDIGQRLRLFQTVCAAVSHAHAHLVVHRDLKPSNLLVTAAGDVKLLDFGIAKLVDSDAVHASLTRVFTPEYAAPEQVRGDVVTTAVDVHALGLLLYELLTGKRPYNVTRSTPAAYERAILSQQPTRPSLAFTGEHAPADLRERSAQREMSAPQLQRELRGDLDAIVLKALRKDPAERYRSVDDFAADIDNHLQRLPVLARRGGWRYRASRFLRRHALAVGSALLVVAALGIGLWIALQQRDIARVEARKSDLVLELMVDNFRLADPGKTEGATITARQLLDRGSLRVSDALKDVPEARALLLETMGRSYLGMGDPEKSLQLYEPALALRRERDDPLPLAASLLLRASALKSLTRNDESMRSLDEVRALLPTLPPSSRQRGIESQLLYLDAMHAFVAKRYPQARDQWTQALAIQRAEFGLDHERTIDTALMLSRVLASQQEFDASLALIQESVQLLRGATPPRPSQLLEALNALGAAEAKRERHDLAELANRESATLSEQVYGPDHWYFAVALNNVGRTLLDQQRHRDALEPMTRAVRIARAALPPTHGFLAVALKNLVVAEAGSGHCAEARRDHADVIDILRQKPDTRGVDPQDLAVRIGHCVEVAGEPTGDASRRR